MNRMNSPNDFRHDDSTIKFVVVIIIIIISCNTWTSWEAELIGRVHSTVETVFVLHPLEFLAVGYSVTATHDEVIRSLLLLWYRH